MKHISFINDNKSEIWNHDKAADKNNTTKSLSPKPASVSDQIFLISNFKLDNKNINIDV